MTKLDHLLGHLAGAGLVRRPGDAGSAPPFWRQPAEGAIAPGDRKPPENDDQLVISAFRMPGLTPGAGEEDYESWTVDLHFRERVVGRAEAAHDAIYRELVLAGNGGPGGRFDWTMDGLWVIRSRPWRDFGLVSSSQAGGWLFVASYLFETRRA